MGGFFRRRLGGHQFIAVLAGEEDVQEQHPDPEHEKEALEMFELILARL